GMILGFAGCWVTARDFSLCTRILDRLEAAESPLAEALRAKLERATIVAPERLPSSVVTLESRVEFSIDDGPREQRTLVWDADHHAIGLHLFLATPRGIGMLGACAGQELPILESGRERKLRVQRVLFQPLQRLETRAETATAPAVIDLSAARMRASARKDGV